MTNVQQRIAASFNSSVHPKPEIQHQSFSQTEEQFQATLFLVRILDMSYYNCVTLSSWQHRQHCVHGCAKESKWVLKRSSQKA
jgi:hypothetical protein